MNDIPRKSGQTGRQLMSAIIAASEGKKVCFTVAYHNQVEIARMQLARICDVAFGKSALKNSGLHVLIFPSGGTLVVQVDDVFASLSHLHTHGTQAGRYDEIYIDNGVYHRLWTTGRSE